MIEFIKTKFMEAVTRVPILRFKRSKFIEFVGPTDYLDEKVLENINKNMKWSYNCVYEFTGLNINLTVISDTKLERTYVHYLNTLIYIFQNIKPARYLDITLIFCNLKKKLSKSKKSEELTPYHVNSGVTYGDHVIVYRREEMGKVLAHELVHFFKLEYHGHNSPELSKYFHLSCDDIYMNESYTDSIACFVNTILHSIIYKKDLKKVFVEEIKFIAGQASKLLKKLGYIYDSQTQQLKRNEPYCEKTHVISYYVLKAIVYLNLPEFINLITRHNLLPINSQEYINFLIKVIPTTIPIIFKIPTTKSLNMRMSSLENFL